MVIFAPGKGECPGGLLPAKSSGTKVARSHETAKIGIFEGL